MSIAPVQVRAARAADSQAIAEVHVASWQGGYAGLLPVDYLAALSVDSYANRWHDTLTTPTPQSASTLVAVVADRLVGFVTVGSARDEDADLQTGEVWALYVLPAVWRRGVATALHDQAMLTLADRGFVSAILWVLDSNHQAQQFYGSQGWIDDRRRKTDWRGELRLDEVRYRRDHVRPVSDSR